MAPNSGGIRNFKGQAKKEFRLVLSSGGKKQVENHDMQEKFCTKLLSFCISLSPPEE